MSENLTKKQQKAAAFRAKQKAKKRGVEVPQDVPDSDLVEGGEETVEDGSSTAAKGNSKGKKRKRAEDDQGDEEAPKTKAKGKVKAKTAWDDDEEGEGEKKTKKDVKQRFILFIGNLGYKSTREDVAKHFSEAAGRTPAVRLLTEKPPPGSKAPPKSRGIAFVELSTSAEMQACLLLHHTILNQRRINVELTAGGGGKSAARKGKIAERNTRVGGQRERRAERLAEEAAKNGSVIPEATAPQEEETVDGYKMRNGRRVKAKTGDKRGDRRTDAPSRKRWEPTGANAMPVGK